MHNFTDKSPSPIRRDKGSIPFSINTQTPKKMNENKYQYSAAPNSVNVVVRKINSNMRSEYSH